MANERIPRDPHRSGLSDDELRSAVREDNELQPDPELAEGPAGRSRTTLLAVAIALVLGAVFYALNNSTMETGPNAPPAQTAQKEPAKPQTTPGAPRPNTEPGTTTGAAPARPQSDNAPANK